MIEYEKDLNELKEQILKEGNVLVSKRALLERFCEMDKEYNGEPWNLLQILSNIDVLVGKEPCEDASDTNVGSKKGHWIMTSDYLTTAYGSVDYIKCSCCGEDSLEEGNYCPNCGAEMESEE